MVMSDVYVLGTRMPASVVSLEFHTHKAAPSSRSDPAEDRRNFPPSNVCRSLGVGLESGLLLHIPQLFLRQPSRTQPTISAAGSQASHLLNSPVLTPSCVHKAAGLKDLAAGRQICAGSTVINILGI